MAEIKDEKNQSSASPVLIEWDVESQEHGQWGFAIIAIFISFMIHAGMAWIASQVDFTLLTRDAFEEPPRRFEAMAVDRVETENQDVTPVLEVLRALNPADQASGDLRESLASLQQQPDAASIEPPTIAPPKADPDLGRLGGATPPPLELEWQPRQEIVAIETRAVEDPVQDLPRREIPTIERVPDAPDIVLPIKTADIPDPSDAVTRISLPPLARIGGSGGDGGGSGGVVPSAILQTGPTVVEDLAEKGSDQIKEEPAEITDATPIEETLKARVDTYMLDDEPYGYFRLTIERAGAEVLPVMPKDMIFVQDTSATIAERRLHFSREGFSRALDFIRPQDRFNIAAFVDQTTYAFTNWVFRTPQHDAVARSFLDQMRAEGNTDFLNSLQDVLQLKGDPERPVIAVVVTDGLMHSGVTDSTEVIARFTRENAGKTSIFTLGVADYANEYLLDMLSHFNMGDAFYVQAGRWDIPEDLLALVRSVSRPVLGDLRVRFGVDSQIEGFPLRPGNLYLDRPLTIYGRYARDEQRLVFYASGKAGMKQSDMVFDLALPVPEEGRGDASIRNGWSQQKMYSLIALYTQTRDRKYLREMSAVARHYDQRVPFRTFFGL